MKIQEHRVFVISLWCSFLKNEMHPGKPYVQVLETRNIYLKGAASEGDVQGSVKDWLCDLRSGKYVLLQFCNSSLFLLLQSEITEPGYVGFSPRFRFSLGFWLLMALCYAECLRMLPGRASVGCFTVFANSCLGCLYLLLSIYFLDASISEKMCSNKKRVYT